MWQKTLERREGMPNFLLNLCKTDVSVNTSSGAAEILFEASCRSNNEGVEGRVYGEGASGAPIDPPPPP